MDHNEIVRRTDEVNEAFLAAGLCSRIASGKPLNGDGNMSRRALEKPEFLSQVTGVPIEIILGLRDLHIALASNLPLCPQKIRAFCLEFKLQYRDLIPWYPLPPAVGQVIDHFHQVIEVFPPTIRSGMLSEEPQEHGNKDIKSAQIDHSRQTSYVVRNLDTCHFLLDRSDPQVLSSLDSPAKHRSADPYPARVLSWCKTDDKTGQIDASEYNSFFSE